MWRRRTKIVCSIGPASSDADVLDGLLEAGMDVARINCSHGSREEHRRTIAAVRAAAARRGCEVSLLGDLAGPKVRITSLPARYGLLRRDDQVELAEGDEGADGEVITITPLGLLEGLTEGEEVAFADGAVRAVVEECDGTRARLRVTQAGALAIRKGVNFPDSDLPLPILTEKDRSDLAFLLEEQVDFVALSFVGTASDIEDVRGFVHDLAPSHSPRLIAKIERRRALREADAIIAAADGIMVARGDLGVEIPVEEVPVEQKRLVHLANRRGRVVITATQMLESMVQLASPTRAEASDVANAILDGTDAVMLSAETAVGAYPVQAVSYMHRIAVATEPSLTDRSLSLVVPDDERVASVADAIGSAARSIADRLPIAAIVAVTESGHSARVLSRYRPPVPIVAVTPDPKAARSLALSFGVVSVVVPRSPSTEVMMQRAMDAGVAEGLLQAGDLCLIAAGIPFGVRGTTNLLKIQSVGEGFLSTGDPYFAD